MNKSELIAVVAQRAGLTKAATERTLNAALDIITDCLVAGERVQLSGFGTFEAKDRKPRVGRNIHTSEALQIDATRVPSFKPSRVLRNTVGK